MLRCAFFGRYGGSKHGIAICLLGALIHLGLGDADRIIAVGHSIAVPTESAKAGSVYKAVFACVPVRMHVRVRRRGCLLHCRVFENEVLHAWDAKLPHPIAAWHASAARVRASSETATLSARRPAASRRETRSAR